MNNRTFLISLSDFPASGKAIFKVGEQSVLVIKSGDNFYAIANKCPHLGLPLTNGKVDRETITCPFHGSRFDLKTGENLDWVTSFFGMRIPEWSRRLLKMGKRPTPLTTFKVIVEGGKLYVEI
mgnify:CR=1 FL=1